ncbi:hypothetical protein D8I24_2659 (plasmid) [Cupriavidus necator H850]|uniref:hypothetical protein n=1 Tax=Cupriavidus necator TaxID=106590 RepID=UPI003FA4660F|nr:hypothetical protein D8I24_2659 [Cupriavidus necator H850]
MAVAFLFSTANATAYGRVPHCPRYKRTPRVRVYLHDNPAPFIDAGLPTDVTRQQLV